MFPSKLMEGGKENSREPDNHPSDLLHRFMSGAATQQSLSQQQQQAAPAIARTRSELFRREVEEDEGELELNLGLSLGGRFGVDKSAKKLIRSSSIVGTIPILREDDANTPPLVPYPALVRTSSLPTETEEEFRKRKELQTLRRMEAKRRRSEKQRNSRERMEVNLLEEEKQLNRGQPFGLRGCAAAARRGVHSGGGNEMGAAEKVVGGLLQDYVLRNSLGSAESHGGSSSSISEMESKALQGSSSYGEARSSGSTQSLQDWGNRETSGSSRTRINELCRTSSLGAENLYRKLETSENSKKDETRMSVMEHMPCVFTKGDGPDGRRIEGILYKYGKGEEVRIMCVCHGTFLSPAEFVKHAGGGDVDHPLRHIVVNPSNASFV